MFCCFRPSGIFLCFAKFGFDGRENLIDILLSILIGIGVCAVPQQLNHIDDFVSSGFCQPDKSFALGFGAFFSITTAPSIYFDFIIQSNRKYVNTFYIYFYIFQILYFIKVFNLNKNSFSGLVFSAYIFYIFL